MKKQKQKAEKKVEIDFLSLPSFFISSNKEHRAETTENFTKHLCVILNLEFSEDILSDYGIDLNVNTGSYYSGYGIKSIAVQIRNTERHRGSRYHKVIFRLTADKHYDIYAMRNKIQDLKDYVESKRVEIEKEKANEEAKERVEKMIEKAFPKKAFIKYQYVEVEIENEIKTTTITVDVSETMQKLKNAEICNTEIKIIEKKGSKEFKYDYNVGFRKSPSKEEYTNAVIDLNSYVSFVNSVFEGVIETLKKTI